MKKPDRRFEVVEKIRSEIRKHDLIELAKDYGTLNLKDKGWIGKTLERFVGLDSSSQPQPDGPDYELKTVKVFNKNGDWQPDQTMAITMLHPSKILQEPRFEVSALWQKIRRLIIVGYSSDLIVRFVRPIDVSDQQLEQRIRYEWEVIRDVVAAGQLYNYSSKGTSSNFIQLRTKGAQGSCSTCPRTGKKFNTRAFYATRRFLRYVWGICDV